MTFARPYPESALLVAPTAGCAQLFSNVDFQRASIGDAGDASSGTTSRVGKARAR